MGKRHSPEQIVRKLRDRMRDRGFKLTSLSDLLN